MYHFNKDVIMKPVAQYDLLISCPGDIVDEIRSYKAENTDSYSYRSENYNEESVSAVLVDG